MKAQFIFENAPWEEEDRSWTEFDMDSGEILLTTKIQTSEEDEEEIEKETIDPMVLDRFLLKKLGIDYEELEQMGMEEEFTIHNYKQTKHLVLFKTNLDDVVVSLTDLFNLAEETRKMNRKRLT